MSYAGEMETPLLNGGSSAELRLIGEDGDYRPAMGWREWRAVFWIETVKLWRIAVPISFTILCQFGLNSLTNIYVGHIGDIELSAFSIAMSVINTFSFGFMVRPSFSISLSFHTHLLAIIYKWLYVYLFDLLFLLSYSSPIC